MCLNMHLNKSHNKTQTTQQQRGSMLVIALFVIIIFALLSLTMTRLLSSSSENVIYEVLGQRALNAARSGLEFCLAAEYQVTITPCATNQSTFNGVVGIAGLNGCSYNVLPINTVTVNDSGASYTYSRFTSEGRCQAGNIVVTRRVYVDALL